MVKNFESKGLVHPEQKEKKKLCVEKFGKERKQKKKGKKGGKEKKNYRTVHQARFLMGSETIISHNGTYCS
jgi:hypothetical protein